MDQALERPALTEVAEQLVTRGNHTQTLYRLVMSTSFLAVLALLVTFVLQWLHVVQSTTELAHVALLTFLALGICGVVFFLAQRGQSLLAIRIYTYGLALVCIGTAYCFEGLRSPGIIGFFVPMVVAGLLGHDEDSWGLGILTLICFALLFQIEPVSKQKPNALGPYPFMGAVLVAESMIAFLTWSIRQELNKFLQESQKRETLLTSHKQQLVERNQLQIELGSELSAAASELQATSQQQASGATEQASAVSEVSTTVEELGTTARQIAQATEHVAQAAQQTLEHLSNGQAAVDESVQAMERIRGRMKDISTRVLGLGERSQQIGEIIDLIDDISDETHLLALNAAIEAAGAGEHGRRFAVVAAEVKNLANRTLTAAKEVQGVIAEIRQATNAAVLAAEEGGKEVELGAELAYRAGQVMDTILMMAERTAQSAAEIGMATAQQQSASEQVVEAMREIAEVARQSASGSRQMAESSSVLTTVADRLHGITQQREV